jgi:hypothetical protein
VHVESAQRGMSSLSRCSLPISVDHSCNVELILRIVPAKKPS